MGRTKILNWTPLTEFQFVGFGRICALACAAGCLEGEPLVEQVPGEPEPTTSESTRSTCAPALALGPDAPMVLGNSLLTLEASGGTGDYEFELTENNSGAILSTLTGAFLAGANKGVSDLVTLHDRGCAGESTLRVQVVDDLRILPKAGTIPPGNTFEFEVTGGSGEYEYTIVNNSSDATMEGARYTAGSTPGVDWIRVTDLRTGDQGEVTLEVDADRPFAFLTEQWMLPVGSRAIPPAVGGTGVWEVVGETEVIRVDEGVLVGETPGRKRLTIRDRFTQETSILHVTVAAPLNVEVPPAGRADSFSGRMVDLGDITGDGISDFAVASRELTSPRGGLRAGRVFIYASAKTSGTTLIQTLEGESRFDEFGSAIIAADFNEDGQIDLAVGCRYCDTEARDGGAIFIFRGTGDGFGWEADQVLTSAGGGDQLGYSLVAADFNGDGRTDLAAGAIGDEDSGNTPLLPNQGSVHIFLGGEEGFPKEADSIVYGTRRRGNGEFEPQDRGDLGFAVTAADFDGDGKDDLAATMISYRADDANPTRDGAVLVFRGQGASELSRGGVETEPSALFVADTAHPNNQFGLTIDTGDVNSDGSPDLVVGWPRFDTPNANDIGQVLVFFGPTWVADATIAFRTTNDADWKVTGDEAGDHLGWSLDVSDVDGDGVHDLVVGSLRVQADEDPANTGAVSIFRGQRDAGPANEPGRRFSSGEGGVFFSQGTTTIGDLDQDGFADILTYAGLTETMGVQTPQPYLWRSASNQVETLEFDYFGGAAQIGFSVGLFDLDGDRSAEVVVGSPEVASHEPYGLRAGLVTGWRVVDPTPESVFDTNGVTFRSQYDQVGYSVFNAGDVDGDGVGDWGYVARYEDAPSTFSDDVFAATECLAQRRINSGAAFIFRGHTDGTIARVPDFVAYGPTFSDSVRRATGLDFDGDGLGDIVVAGTDWRDESGKRAGGVQILAGRPPVAGKSVVLCEPLLRLSGSGDRDGMGQSVVGLGDLDRDGCDELAVSSDRYDGYGPDQGQVLVVLGMGKNCVSGRRAIPFKVDGQHALLGHAMGAGDIDGDGQIDLAIGAYRYRVDNATTGGAWVLPGAHIADHVSRDHTFTLSDSNDFPDAFDLPPALRILAPIADEDFGVDVSILPASPRHYGALAVGAMRGSYGSETVAGNAFVYRLAAVDRFEDTPAAVFSGESERDNGRLGHSVSMGWVNNEPYWAIGGYQASGLSIDAGAVYSAPLDGLY